MSDGSDAQVVDIPVDHPSASKQHAVLQYRQVVERNEFGDTKSITKCAASPHVAPSSASLTVCARRPFILDLESANGTLVNDETVPASRYYELRSGDGEFSSLLVQHCNQAGLLNRSLCWTWPAVIKFAFSTREYVLLVES